MRNKRVLIYLVLLITYYKSTGQISCNNLIVNPTIQPNEGCSSGNITSNCYEGWSAASGTPNTSGNGAFFIWAYPCLDNSEALMGTLTAPLTEGKSYEVCFSYKTLNDTGSSNYDGVADIVYMEFSDSLQYIKANGTEYLVPNSTGFQTNSLMLFNGGKQDSAAVISNIMTLQTTCPLPGVKYPDTVTIEETGETVTKVWKGVSLNNYLNYKDTCITFTAREASEYFFFSIMSNDQIAQAITIKDLLIREAFPELDPEVDFITAQSLCAIQFNEEIYNPLNHTILSYHWDFGDGNSSSEISPIHVYDSPGTYQVIFTVDLVYCNDTLTLSKEREVTFDIPEDLFEDITVNVPTDLILEVISASATTFSDTWPLEHLNQMLAEKHPYRNGSKGVWRANSSYIYDVQRAASSPVNIAIDGSFTLENFNWEYAELEAIPNWIKAREITLYSPYSYELGNKDVLGNYSAALYDYGGQMPSANGVNMRNAEMAFTGFEYLEGKESGNWRLQNDAIPLYQYYKVRIGAGNIALVEASMEELEMVNEVDVYAYNILGFGRDIIRDNAIICKQPYDQNPDWTLISFERPVSVLYWAGSLIKKNDPQPIIGVTLDTIVAHSGRKSLKVNTSLSLKQELLKLAPDKAYMVSTWVSVNNPNVVAPDLGNGLGITLTFKDKGETELLNVAFAPTGPVIEGWQQIKGEFIYPGEESVMEVTFNPGSGGAAWYDDLRLHPVEGNMQSYVYDIDNYRLTAILDENNYASFYYYDAEGNLYLVKKETIEGIKTISENISYTKAAAQP